MCVDVRFSDGSPPAPAFVLIHSPLVGPFTWSPVAEELRRRGIKTVVPTVVDYEGDGARFSRQHADAVIGGVAAIPPTVPLVLVGHSGAGPLLPAIRLGIEHPVAAYVFVDAGIPADGKSRLELMEVEESHFARDLRLHLSAGNRFPEWSEEDLVAILPESRLRRRLLDELRPRTLAFFAEPIPVFAGWPDAPCGYLKFSPAYDMPARYAREAGWRYREIAAGHFHLLIDPSAVADALLDLVEHPLMELAGPL